MVNLSHNMNNIIHNCVRLDPPPIYSILFQNVKYSSKLFENNQHYNLFYLDIYNIRYIIFDHSLSKIIFVLISNIRF